MANRHIKNCSTSLIIRERQIKTTRYHTIPFRMAINKKDYKYQILERMWREGNQGTLLMGR